MSNDILFRSVAFCTIAAVAFAGVLYAVLTSGAVEDVLTDLVVNALGSGF